MFLFLHHGDLSLMNDLFFSLQGTKPSSVDDDLSSKQGDIITI